MTPPSPASVRSTRRSLLFVAAHPDDDTFGIGGTLALHSHDQSLRFVLVHFTDGEAGEIAPDVVASRSGLGSLRREEDERSWRLLGRSPDRHEWLGLPDGSLQEIAITELARRVSCILQDERPDIVATFGPNGIDGHPDHIAVSLATTQAFLVLAGGEGPGLKRLLYSAIRQSTIDRWNQNRLAMGRKPWDPTRVFELRGVPDETIGIDVDVSGVSERLVMAVREHRSQWPWSKAPDAQLIGSLRRECWVIGWPQRAAGAPELRSVFEGL